MNQRNKNKRKDLESQYLTKSFNLIKGVEIEQGAIAQMENAMSLPVSLYGALMPDAHEGYGLPIGGVLATDSSVIPYAVGMDIGCTMTLSVFETERNFIKKHREKLTRVLVENTRFGTEEFKEKTEAEVLERREFKEIKFLKKLHQTAVNQFGTSGRGNHFVEFGIVEISEFNKTLGLVPGTYFGILSHSGSRHFGYQIAKHYSKIAAELSNLPPQLRNLAWLELTSEEGEEYWKAMTLAGDYAKENHFYIHNRLANKLGMKPLTIVQNHHNFAWKEQYKGREVIVHRKGATPAYRESLGIIPGNMVKPAFIVKGKGNEESLFSASHGAGRAMSRKKAKGTFRRADLDHLLAHYGVTLIGGGLDEHPKAYKDIEKVINVQNELIDVLGKFYPKIVRME